MAGQTYRVQRAFLHHNEGEVVTAKQCEPADVNYLIECGALKPLTAGGIPLVAGKQQTFPEDTDLEEIAAENSRLRDEAEGWKIKALAAEQVAGERLESLANLSQNFELAHGQPQETTAAGVTETQKLRDELESERKRAADAEAELAELRNKAANPVPAPTPKRGR